MTCQLSVLLYLCIPLTSKWEQYCGTPCTNLRSVCSVTAHLARLEGGGDLGPAPATAALLGLLRDVMAGAGHSVVEVSCDWSG